MKQNPSNPSFNKRPRCFSVWKKRDSVELGMMSCSCSIPEDTAEDSSNFEIPTKSYQRPSHIPRILPEGRSTPMTETDASSDFYARTPDSLLITPTKMPYRPYAGIYKSFNKLATLDQLSTEESFLSNLYYNDSTSRDIQGDNIADLSCKEEYSPESVISQYNTPQRRYNSILLHEIEAYNSPEKTQFSQMIDISLGDSFISERNISPIANSNRQSIASGRNEKVFDLLSSLEVRRSKEIDTCNTREEKNLPYLGSMPCSAYCPSCKSLVHTTIEATAPQNFFTRTLYRIFQCCSMLGASEGIHRCCHCLEAIGTTVSSVAL